MKQYIIYYSYHDWEYFGKESVQHSTSVWANDEYEALMVFCDYELGKVVIHNVLEW